ncbi:MAG: trehalose-phosphatase [Sphingomicrobium sp.]
MRPLPTPPAALLDRASLFLDFDGTLTEFVDPSGDPSPGQPTLELLAALGRRLNGRVAIISGRSLDSLAGLVTVDGLDLTGSHGLERRRSDGIRTPLNTADFSALHEEGRQLAGQLGILLEEKPAGAAFHYRGKPRLEGDLVEAVEQLAARHDVEFRRGAMVVEVRAPGPNKGDALRTMMREMPFAEGVPLFVGDDITDEDGFEAATALGGDAILVGDPRETAANFGLPSVAATLDWLGQ